MVTTNGDGVKFVVSSGSCTVSNRLTVQFTGVGICSLTAEVSAGSIYPQAAGNPQAIAVKVPPPTTAIVMPANNAAQSGTAALLDALASSGVVGVSFEISGGTLSNDVIATATPTLYGWVAQWNTTIIPNGTYTLHSVASYPSGDTGTSPGVTITVANPPATAVLIPSNGAVQSGTAAQLDAGASSGVATVKFEISGGKLTNAVIATATPTLFGWAAQWNTTSVPNGTYTLHSVATYGNGPSGTSPGVTITVDNPPTTAIILPANGAAQSGTAALLDALASSGVVGVSFEISGGTLSNDVIATATPTLYGWVAQWNTAVVPNGTYTLHSVASYPNGERGTSPGVTITVAH